MGVYHVLDAYGFKSLFIHIVRVLKSIYHLIMNISHLLLFVVFLFPLCIYFIPFHNGFSNNHEAWSAFGDYISGIYSVVLTIFMFYLANKVEKMNERRNDRKNAIKELYNYVVELSSRDININKANDFQLCINKNQLFLLHADYKKLIDFYDYCLAVISNELNRDIQKERIMKDYLINLYNDKS